MAFQQSIDKCFSVTAGGVGLDRATYDVNLTRCGSGLAKIRSWHAEDALPLLGLPAKSEDLDMLRHHAAAIRATYTDAVVLGTGGSSLGAQALAALAPPGGPVRLHLPDNLDAQSLYGLIGGLDLQNTAFLSISKSGGTPETLAQTLVCLNAVVEAVGKDAAGSHFIAITEPGDNPLRRLAARWSMTALDHDPGVGGRYSVLSLVGLLPALILGIDADAIRRGAAAVLDQTLAADVPAKSWVAAGAALAKTAMDAGLRASVLMPYSDRLIDFSKWYCQLWAESLGKGGKGSLPVYALGPVDQHSQLQLYLDGPNIALYTVMTCPGAYDLSIPVEIGGNDPDYQYLSDRTVGDLVAAEARAIIETMSQNGRPVRVFTLDGLDEETMGGLLMHFMLETILTADLLDVDAFDQPAVEQGKELTRQYLAAQTREESTQV
jgi:glucose-6-phosphate isomerase